MEVAGSGLQDLPEVAGSGLQDLPEGCIAHVISLTCPRDSCRSAAASPAFRSASESDTVWDRFLPPDIRSVLDRAVHPVQFSSKKELFFRLCDPILIDGGRMSFALDKSSGAKCYMLSARALKIIWGDTTPYWQWLSADDCRHGGSVLSTQFSEVARLLDVCWLEIRGNIDRGTLSPNTNYAAYFVFKMGEETTGFSYPAQKVSVKVGAHESIHMVLLEPMARQLRVISRRHGPRRRHILRGMFLRDLEEEVEETAGDVRIPCLRADGWMEIEMGEFFNDDGLNGEVEMCLTEIEGGHWKTGLIVQGIEVRPKKN